MADSGQKTEQPTQRRLEKARKDGQFPSSPEFVSAVQFTVFLALASYLSEGWITASKLWLKWLIEAGFRTTVTSGALSAFLQLISWELLLPLLLSGGGVMVMTLAAQFAVTGLGFAPGKLAPDFKRLNPLNRIKNLPRQNLPQLFQALVLLPLFGYAVWTIASEDIASFLRLPRAPVPAGAAVLASAIHELAWKAAGLFLLVGTISLIRQKRRWLKDMRMSKQDVREEMKESEGDPQIKARIRRIQRDLLRRRMMKDVETATAVVVNPTHFAVAIRYVPAEMPAPKVVAMGKNFLALRIRDRATKHQVPIIENPPLAQALYGSSQVGQEIPAFLYRAVAEVLAYIYRLRNRMG
jgi:flagellar biosynthetic protein FlhB